MRPPGGAVERTRAVTWESALKPGRPAETSRTLNFRVHIFQTSYRNPNYNDILLFSVGSMYAMMMWGWTNEQTVEYTGILQAANGAFSLIFYGGFAWTLGV